MPGQQLASKLVEASGSFLDGQRWKGTLLFHGVRRLCGRRVAGGHELVRCGPACSMQSPQLLLRPFGKKSSRGEKSS
jgi:hypothetical protein